MENGGTVMILKFNKLMNWITYFNNKEMYMSYSTRKNKKNFENALKLRIIVIILYKVNQFYVCQFILFISH